MNNILSKIIIFSAGAAIGSVVTWKILNNRYEQLIEEEIESIKEAYAKSYDDMVYSDIEESEEENKAVIEEYKDIASEYDNGDESNYGEEEDSMDMPYLISPDEYAESEYEAASLWYFADGVLTDEQYNVIEDIEETVGVESLEHFGDYLEDPDTVYVRNDYLEVDYEICRDERMYSEICE